MNDQEYESLRLYLATEDERERSNRQAEQAKQHIKRRCALIYGDSGSHPLPLAACRSCDDSLTADNRSPIMGQCQACFEESCWGTVTRANPPPVAAPVAVVAKPDRASGWILTGLVCGVISLGAFVLLWKVGVLP